MEQVPSQSDARTANNTDAVRHNYRLLSDAEKAAMVEVKDLGAAFLDRVKTLGQESPAPTGEQMRCFALAKTKIEEAVMWAVKGITT